MFKSFKIYFNYILNKILTKSLRSTVGGLVQVQMVLKKKKRGQVLAELFLKVWIKIKAPLINWIFDYTNTFSHRAGATYLTIK